MVPADPTMDITQQLLPLFNGDAALLDPGVASPVELALNNDKGLGMMRETPSLYFIHWQRLTEQVVEVRCPLVGQRVELCCWILVKLHDFAVRWSHWLVSPRTQGRRSITGLFRLLVVDKGLVLIANKDAR